MFFLRYYLWITPNLILTAIIAIGWRRDLHRKFPVFFTSIGFQLFQFVTLFLMSRILAWASAWIYHWTLAITTAIAAILQIGVLFELANALLLSRLALTKSLRLLLKWSLAALLLLAAATSAGLISVGLSRGVRFFDVVDFSASLVQVGLLLVLILFARVLQISWRSWPAGVALGLGISACINLSAAALLGPFGRLAFIPVDLAQMIAFHASVLVWLTYLFLPDNKPGFAGHGLAGADIQFWDQQLERIGQR